MTSTESVLNWLCRDYNSFEHWKSVARMFFMATISHPFGDSDSVKARTLVADHLRYVFQCFVPQQLDVQRWKDGFRGIETFCMSPPQVDEGDLNGVDWEHIADYFLQHLRAEDSVVESLNNNRDELQNKLEERLSKNIDRATSHFQKTVAYMAEQGVRLPKEKLDNSVTDIRKRLVLIEEEDTKKHPTRIKLAHIHTYKGLDDEELRSH